MSGLGEMAVSEEALAQVHNDLQMMDNVVREINIGGRFQDKRIDRQNKDTCLQ